jgi:phage/plasmid-like protein (TIGR03299 family)
MTKERIEDLNCPEANEWSVGSLIGFTAQRGNAWHYRLAFQGDESNHYEGPIPVEAIERRLFNWTARPARVAFLVPCDVEDPRMSGIDEDGAAFRLVLSQHQDGRVGWLRSDNDYDLNVSSAKYKGHQYREWLLRTVEALMEDGVGIGSAGVLQKGGRAWVSIEMPESRHVEGFEYRPSLLAAGSFDHSLATVYKRIMGVVVCDNTLEAGLFEEGFTVKARHTLNSGFKLDQARRSLAILEQAGDNFDKALRIMLDAEVTTAQYEQIVTKLVPDAQPKDGKPVTKAAVTRVETKRATLNAMWVTDTRVQPWANTALGVIQAFNTWEHHIKGVRGGDGASVGELRAERNSLGMLTGKFAKVDQLVVATLRDMSLLPALAR